MIRIAIRLSGIRVPYQSCTINCVSALQEAAQITEIQDIVGSCVGAWVNERVEVISYQQIFCFS